MLKLSDSYYTIAHNLIAMIVQKLPYILFRSYSSYGYLTDNRNFGYDTASHSCKKVGELILSNTGKVFYANLKDIPEKLDDVILRLSKLYSAVPVAVISRDALEFYKELHSKGFIFMGAEHDFADFVSHYFSSSNPQSIGFSGILLAKRQNSFYCTYFLHNRNVADTKSPYPIKRLEVIRRFNQKSMAFNQSLS